MREQYITKKFIKKQLNEIKKFCICHQQEKFVDDRLCLIEKQTYRNAIKYLFAETIVMLNTPHLWKNDSQ